jgi:predicted RNase H-like HicB family nuclease
MVEKSLEYYLGLAYPVQVYSKPGGSGYAAEFPDLPGCVAFADSLGELLDMIEDAKRTWIETSLRAGLPVPEPASAGSAEPASASPRPEPPGLRSGRRLGPNARPEGSAKPVFSGDATSNGAITVHSLRSLYLKLLEQARGDGVDLSQFIRVALADTVGYRRTSG